MVIELLEQNKLIQTTIILKTERFDIIDSTVIINSISKVKQNFSSVSLSLVS